MSTAEETLNIRGDKRRVSFSDQTENIDELSNGVKSNQPPDDQEMNEIELEKNELTEGSARSVRDRTPTPPVLKDPISSNTDLRSVTVNTGHTVSSIRLGSFKNLQYQQNGNVHHPVPSSINYDSSTEIANIKMGTDEPEPDVNDLNDVEVGLRKNKNTPKVESALPVQTETTGNTNSSFKPNLQKEVNFNPKIVPNSSNVIKSGLEFDGKKRVMKKPSNSPSRSSESTLNNNNATPVGTADKRKKVNSYDQVNAVQREIRNEKKLLRDENYLTNNEKKPCYKSNFIYIIIIAILFVLAIIAAIVLGVAYVRSNIVDWEEDKGKIVSKYNLTNLNNQVLNNVLMSPNAIPNSTYFLFELGSQTFWFQPTSIRGLSVSWNKGREVKVHTMANNIYVSQVLGDFLRDGGIKNAVYSVHLSSNRWHSIEFSSTEGFSLLSVQQDPGNPQAYLMPPSKSDLDSFPKEHEAIIKKFTKS